MPTEVVDTLRRGGRDVDIPRACGPSRARPTIVDASERARPHSNQNLVNASRTRGVLNNGVINRHLNGLSRRSAEQHIAAAIEVHIVDRDRQGAGPDRIRIRERRLLEPLLPNRLIAFPNLYVGSARAARTFDIEAQVRPKHAAQFARRRPGPSLRRRPITCSNAHVAAIGRRAIFNFEANVEGHSTPKLAGGREEPLLRIGLSTYRALHVRAIGGSSARNVETPIRRDAAEHRFRRAEIRTRIRSVETSARTIARGSAFVVRIGSRRDGSAFTTRAARFRRRTSLTGPETRHVTTKTVDAKSRNTRPIVQTRSTIGVQGLRLIAGP